jgi:hypothetical protein
MMQRRAFVRLATGAAVAIGATAAGYVLVPRVAAGGASQRARIHAMVGRPTASAAHPMTLRQA